MKKLRSRKRSRRNESFIADKGETDGSHRLKLTNTLDDNLSDDKKLKVKHSDYIQVSISPSKLKGRKGRKRKTFDFNTKIKSMGASVLDTETFNINLESKKIAAMLKRAKDEAWEFDETNKTVMETLQTEHEYEESQNPLMLPIQSLGISKLTNFLHHEFTSSAHYKNKINQMLINNRSDEKVWLHQDLTIYKFQVVNKSTLVLYMGDEAALAELVIISMEKGGIASQRHITVLQEDDEAPRVKGSKLLMGGNNQVIDDFRECFMTPNCRCVFFFGQNHFDVVKIYESTTSIRAPIKKYTLPWKKASIKYYDPMRKILFLNCLEMSYMRMLSRGKEAGFNHIFSKMLNRISERRKSIQTRFNIGRHKGVAPRREKQHTTTKIIKLDSNYKLSVVSNIDHFLKDLTLESLEFMQHHKTGSVWKPVFRRLEFRNDAESDFILVFNPPTGYLNIINPDLFLTEDELRVVRKDKKRLTKLAKASKQEKEGLKSDECSMKESRLKQKSTSRELVKDDIHLRKVIFGDHEDRIALHCQEYTNFEIQVSERERHVKTFFVTFLDIPGAEYSEEVSAESPTFSIIFQLDIFIFPIFESGDLTGRDLQAKLLFSRKIELPQTFSSFPSSRSYQFFCKGIKQMYIIDTGSDIIHKLAIDTSSDSPTPVRSTEFKFRKRGTKFETFDNKVKFTSDFSEIAYLWNASKLKIRTLASIDSTLRHRMTPVPSSLNDMEEFINLKNEYYANIKSLGARIHEKEMLTPVAGLTTTADKVRNITPDRLDYTVKFLQDSSEAFVVQSVAWKARKPAGDPMSENPQRNNNELLGFGFGSGSMSIARTEVSSVARSPRVAGTAHRPSVKLNHNITTITAGNRKIKSINSIKHNRASNASNQQHNNLNMTSNSHLMSSRVLNHHQTLKRRKYIYEYKESYNIEFFELNGMQKVNRKQVIFTWEDLEFKKTKTGAQTSQSKTKDCPTLELRSLEVLKTKSSKYFTFMLNTWIMVKEAKTNLSFEFSKSGDLLFMNGCMGSKQKSRIIVWKREERPEDENEDKVYYRLVPSYIVLRGRLTNFKMFYQGSGMMLSTIYKGDVNISYYKVKVTAVDNGGAKILKMTNIEYRIGQTYKNVTRVSFDFDQNFELLAIMLYKRERSRMLIWKEEEEVEEPKPKQPPKDTPKININNFRRRRESVRVVFDPENMDTDAGILSRLANLAEEAGARREARNARKSVQRRTSKSKTACPTNLRSFQLIQQIDLKNLVKEDEKVIMLRKRKYLLLGNKFFFPKEMNGEFRYHMSSKLLADNIEIMQVFSLNNNPSLIAVRFHELNCAPNNTSQGRQGLEDLQNGQNPDQCVYEPDYTSIMSVCKLDDLGLTELVRLQSWRPNTSQVTSNRLCFSDNGVYLANIGFRPRTSPEFPEFTVVDIQVHLENQVDAQNDDYLKPYLKVRRLFEYSYFDCLDEYQCLFNTDTGGLINRDYLTHFVTKAKKILNENFNYQYDLNELKRENFFEIENSLRNQNFVDFFLFLHNFHAVLNLPYLAVIDRNSSLLEQCLKQFGYLPGLYEDGMDPIEAAMDIREPKTLEVVSQFLMEFPHFVAEFMTRERFTKMLGTSNTDLQRLCIEHYVNKSAGREGVMGAWQGVAKLHHVCQESRGFTQLLNKIKYYPLADVFMGADVKKSESAMMNCYLHTELSKKINRAGRDKVKSEQVEVFVTKSKFSTNIVHMSCMEVLKSFELLPDDFLTGDLSHVIHYVWHQNRLKWILPFILLHWATVTMYITHVVFLRSHWYTAYPAMLLAFMHLLFELFVMFQDPSDYFSEYINFFDIFLYVGMMITSGLTFFTNIPCVDPDDHCTFMDSYSTSKNWNLTINLLILLSGFRALSGLRVVYEIRYMIAMISNVFWATRGFAIVLAFLIGFYMILGYNLPSKFHGSDQISSISKSRETGIRRFFLEFDYAYRSWFWFSEDPTTLNASEYAVFFSSSILISIILANLVIGMIGQTFGDYQEKKDLVDIKQTLEMLVEYGTILSYFRPDAITDGDRANMSYLCVIAKDEVETVSEVAGGAGAPPIPSPEILEKKALSASTPPPSTNEGAHLEEIRMLRQEVRELKEMVAEQSRTVFICNEDFRKQLGFDQFDESRRDDGRTVAGSVRFKKVVDSPVVFGNLTPDGGMTAREEGVGGDDVDRVGFMSQRNEGIVTDRGSLEERGTGFQEGEVSEKTEPIRMVVWGAGEEENQKHLSLL